jgi:DNA (cytosine-5)-methyltransferase 1
MGGNNLMLTAGSICAGMGGLEMGISEVIPLTLRWVTEYEPPTEKNPNPRQAATRGGQRLAPRFVEWMMGLPDGWVTAVPGLSRNDQLKILGNGVVPQQAAEAIRRLMPYTPAWVRERIGWADTRTYSPVA